mgnify:FL=1
MAGDSALPVDLDGTLDDDTARDALPAGADGR